MAAHGAEIYCDIKELSVFGLFDVLKKLPRFFALKKLILEKIEKEKPDAIVLIDFSGFNLRLAKSINKKIPVIYYISPQVWASRPGRIKTIKEYIHQMIVVFRFEEEFYKKYGVKVKFVGHPLLDITKPSLSRHEFYNRFSLYENKITIALLPGSRNQEIKNILPIMLKAASLMHQKIPLLQFVIAKSSQVEWGIYNRLTAGTDLDLKIIEGFTYDCLNIANLALVASGTATLETALIEVPFMIIYKMNLLNYLLYRPQVKVPHIGMVNIVAGKEIIPEFIQFQAKPEKIADEALKILQDPTRRNEIKNGLKETVKLLGEKGAARRAAETILELV